MSSLRVPVTAVLVGASLWAVATCAVAALVAEGGQPARAELRIERVALFKNGLGYFRSSATLPAGASAVTLGALPIASYGTFWLGYDRDTAVAGLKAGNEEVAEQVTVESVGELIAANVGRRMAVQLDKLVSGTLTRVVSPGAPKAESPYRMGARTSGGSDPWSGLEPWGSGTRGGWVNAPRQPRAGGGLAFLRTAEGTVAFDPSTVTRVWFDGEDPVTVVERRSTRPSLRLELARPAGGRAVSVSYLARGISWAPSYRIDLSRAGTARVSAQAEIVNEVADLDGVEVELVTGFPYLRFGNVPSPIALSQPLETFLQRLQGPETAVRSRGVGAQQVWVGANEASMSSAIDIAPPSVGREAEDLFLYPLPPTTLRMGETVLVPLFTAEMPYEHVYTWEIADALDDEERYRSPSADGDPVVEEVWHACRLTNTAKLPLTTAAAEFESEGQIVGQGMAPFTNVGDKATIRINRAMRIVAEQAESEVDRKRDAVTFNGYRYDQVHLRGELRLRSRLDSAARVEVTKSLSGEVDHSTGDPKVTRVGKGLRAINPRQEMRWTVDLAPGEERLLSYDSTVFIRQ
jgi:hypothetical protein